MKPTYDCFLSYSSLDVHLADAVYRRLVSAGYSVWWDRRYLDAGTEWRKEIQESCEASRVVIPILTPNWKGSPWTRFETYGAGKVIPLLAEGIWEDVTTPPLRRYQASTLSPLSAGESEWAGTLSRIDEILRSPLPGRTPRTTHLRLLPIKYFVGRDDVIAEIHEKLFAVPTTNLTSGNAVAISSLGGGGKTTVARQYAEYFWRCYSQLFWIDCGSGLETGFSQVHDLLFPEAAASGLTTTQKCAIAKRELDNPDGPLRLLILDDALDEESVRDWLPKTGTCHTILTSRYSSWSPSIMHCPLPLLDKESAAALLFKRSGLDGTEECQIDAANRVAHRLQYLPLALEHAAAYIRQQRDLGFDGYLAIFNANEEKFLGRFDPAATEYPHSILLTWRTTIDKLDPGPRAILRWHAFFAASPFPLKLYITPQLAPEVQAAGRSEGLEIDEFLIREWCNMLAAYSMMRTEKDDCVSVHPLVQAVERYSLGASAPATSIRAARAFFDQVPKPSHDVGTWRIFGPHAETLASNRFLPAWLRALIGHQLADSFKFAGNYSQGIVVAKRACKDWEEANETEHKFALESVGLLASLLCSDGDYDAAEAFDRQVLEVRRRVLGSDHKDTLRAVNNLSITLSKKGDYSAALSLCEQALGKIEVLCGHDDPLTLLLAENVAELHERLGNYPKAEDLFRGTLERYQRLFGVGAFETASPLQGLGGLLHKRGDYQAAEPLLQLALGLRERTLGPDHPDTLTCLNSLARLKLDQSKLSEAKLLFWRALESSRRIHGDNHPNTVGFANNFGQLMWTAGDYEEAEVILDKSVLSARDLWGNHHPYTLVAMNDLALVKHARAKLSEAEQLLRLVLEERQDLGSPDHETLKVMGNLGEVLRDSGQYRESETWLRGALTGMDQSIGSDHPDTLRAASNLSCLLCDTQRFREAEPLERRTLRAKERDLGADHAGTLLSVNNLAYILHETGDTGNAELFWRRALSGFEKTLGGEHPTTLSVVNNLAELLRRKRDYKEALPLYLRAVEAQEDKLGDSHPDTLRSLNNLALLYEGTGQWHLAEECYRRAAPGLVKSLGLAHPLTKKAVGNFLAFKLKRGLSFGLNYPVEVLSRFVERIYQAIRGS